MQTEQTQTTETESTESSQTDGFRDYLDGSAEVDEETEETESEESQEAEETESDDDPPEPPAASEETQQTQPTLESLQQELEAERAKNAEKEKQVNGMLNALKAERAKARAAQGDDFYSDTEDDRDPAYQAGETSADTRFTALSEELTKSKYKDFDELSREFDLAAAENPHLAQIIQGSVNPAEAKYQAAHQLRLQKKYGTTSIPEMAEKMRAELTKELREEIRKELEAEVTKKADQRSKTGTDISGARASGGKPIKTDDEERVPSFQESLSQALAG